MTVATLRTGAQALASEGFVTTFDPEAFFEGRTEGSALVRSLQAGGGA